MRNLIYANMKRIWKTRAFRMGAVFVAALALFQILVLYFDYVMNQGIPYFDNNLFSIAAMGIFPLAAFVPLYIGTEFNDGTIRNKLVAGQGRWAVYLANLVTAVIAGWLLIAIWSVVYLVPGVILLKSANPFSLYILVYVGMLCEMAVFSALFTFISMLLGNRAGSAVACILLTLVILIGGIVISATLEEEEFYSPEYQVSESGEIEYIGELQPNPNYLPEGSRKRAVYEFLLDFTIGGQALQIAGIQTEHINWMMLYDCGWFVVMSGIGVMIFQRKDLK